MFVVGLAAYFARLTTAPPGISGDAFHLGIWALDFLCTNTWPFYIYHLFAPSPLIIYLQAPVFAAFGFTLTAQQELTAFIGALTVPAVYTACGKLLSGRGRRFAHHAGLIAALGMALNPFLAEFSHYGTEHVLLPLLSVLSAAFLWRADVGQQAQVAMLLAGSGRDDHSVVVVLQVMLDIHPGQVFKAHSDSSKQGVSGRDSGEC